MRDPKLVVTTGKTPVPTPDQARDLLYSIEPRTIAGLRDRALIAALIHTAARIEAVLVLRFKDYHRRERPGCPICTIKATSSTPCPATTSWLSTSMIISKRPGSPTTKTARCSAPLRQARDGAYSIFQMP